MRSEKANWGREATPTGDLTAADLRETFPGHLSMARMESELADANNERPLERELEEKC